MNASACTRPWFLRTGHADNSISTYLHDPLWVMLGLSLVIHLLVLVWLTLQPQQIQFSLPVSELAVHLQDNQTKTALGTSPPALKPVTTAVSSPVPMPARIKTTPAKTDARRHSIIKPKVTAKTAQMKPAETARARITTTLASRPSPTAQHALSKKPAAQISLSRIISRLHQDLKQYFYYPRLARRENIQGGVVLGFAINRQGKIKNIHVVKSSGFAILDFAAEDALRQLDKLNWNRDYLQHNNRHIELPVIYKLTES